MKERLPCFKCGCLPALEHPKRARSCSMFVIHMHVLRCPSCGDFVVACAGETEATSLWNQLQTHYEAEQWREKRRKEGYPGYDETPDCFFS